MTLTLRPSGSGAWSVKKGHGETIVSGPTRMELNRRQTDVITAYLAALPDDEDGLWRMELGTHLIIESVHEVGAAEAIADLCARAERRAFSIESEVEPSLDAVRQALAARGLRTRGLGRVRTRAAATFVFAAIAALTFLVADLLRFRGTGRKAVPDDPMWLAAAGEWTNRTRHLLRQAPEGGTCSLLLIGRPRRGESALIDLLQRHLPGRRFRLVRPHSLYSLAAAAGEIGSRLARGLRIVTASAQLPSFRDLTAIIYRFALGCASAKWWEASGARPGVVVYAHTCNADTSLLERAQQRLGSTTVHLFHGLSQGHNFAGISDLAIPLCVHDERLHERLGRYRRIRSFVEPAPAPAAARAPWLLLTNYANPLNPDFRATGVAIEVMAIDLVAEAARRWGVEAEKVTYRPHPVFALLSDEHQDAIRAKIAAARFRFWPEGQGYEDIAGYACVITTPSTAAIDLLRLGRIPVMLDLRGTDAATANGAFPLTAASLDELVDAVRLVEERHDALFGEAWTRIGPARLPELREIVEAASAIRER